MGQSNIIETLGKVVERRTRFAYLLITLEERVRTHRPTIKPRIIPRAFGAIPWVILRSYLVRGQRTDFGPYCLAC